MLTEAEGTCANCTHTIWLYTHSQAGPLRARAWTDVYPDGDDDPRYGTQCDYSPNVGGYGPHELETEEG